MQITVTNITGFSEAFEAMFISKRSWTPELAQDIRQTCFEYEVLGFRTPAVTEKFEKWLDMLLRMGKKHITVLRFIDIAIMTEGLHRAGQDDVDAHARRFDNRIIRSSTRLATFDQDEFSDYYQDKVVTTDTMLTRLGSGMPDKVIEDEHGAFYAEEDCKNFSGAIKVKNVWVKSPNGYVLEQYENNKDVKRGLYMLGIPSNFISKINLTEWAHVFKERNENGGANPEVKEWAEGVMARITEKYPKITREYVLSIEN